MNQETGTEGRHSSANPHRPLSGRAIGLPHDRNEGAKLPFKTAAFNRSYLQVGLYESPFGTVRQCCRSSGMRTLSALRLIKRLPEELIRRHVAAPPF